jgi:trigger factor
VPSSHSEGLALNSTESTETKPTCVREIEVEVPADVVTKEVEALLKRYTKVAKVPGFRPGKVPPSVVKRQFGDGLMQEAVENVVNRVTPEEIRKRDFTPVSQPRVVDLHAHEGEPLRYKAVFEIMPQFEVSDYTGLAPETPEIHITDDEVEEALKTVQQQHATYNAVEEERALTDGDFAQVSLEGTPHPVASETEAAPAESPEGSAETPAEPSSAEAGEQPTAEAAAEAKAKPAEQPVKVDDVMIELGNPNTVKEFSDNLRGLKPGESSSFDVAYPEDYSDKRLAGRTFSYAVTVKGIKSKSVPELNDDFAKELGDFANLDDVRQRIREGMEHERRHKVEHEAKDKIMDTLIDRADFPVPNILIEQAINHRLDRGLRALAAQGMKQEDMRRLDFQRLRDAQREAAERDVKAALLLDRIADMENIDVSDEEIDAQVVGLAQQHRQPVEQVRESLLREGGLGRIRDTLREQKTIEFLYRGTVPGPATSPEASASEAAESAGTVTETESK